VRQTVFVLSTPCLVLDILLHYVKQTVFV
jgi:hypothetical protein